MYDVGVFWVLVRVLACGGLAVMVWLFASGQLQKKQVAEVRRLIVHPQRTNSNNTSVVCRWNELAAAVPAASRLAHRVVPTTFNSVRTSHAPRILGHSQHCYIVSYCSLISLQYGSGH